MKKAFTLIELLVVIAIIALLAAILFPVFTRVREKARQSTCQSNLKQMSLSYLQYVQDNDETSPFAYIQNTGKSWKDSMEPYLRSKQVLLCPSNLGRNSGISYSPNSVNGYNYGAGPSQINGVFGYQDAWGVMNPAKLSQMNDAASLIVFCETNWSNGNLQPANAFYSGANGPSGPFRSICLFSGHTTRGNYAFADGHVKALLPFNTVTVAENGTAPLNMWRRDGKPYTNFGTYDQEFTNSQTFLRAAANYFN